MGRRAAGEVLVAPQPVQPVSHPHRRRTVRVARPSAYAALRKVCRVILTVQLQRFPTNAPLRRRVTAATVRAERFNRFSQGSASASTGVSAGNGPVEQGRAMKFGAHDRGDLPQRLSIAENVRRLLEEAGRSTRRTWRTSRGT